MGFRGDTDGDEDTGMEMGDGNSGTMMGNRFGDTGIQDMNEILIRRSKIQMDCR